MRHAAGTDPTINIATLRTNAQSICFCYATIVMCLATYAGSPMRFEHIPA